MTARKKTVPDSVSATLDYDLAVALATHVDHSDEYESRADFLRAALWEKLKDDAGTTDVLDHYIQRQKERVQELERERRQVTRKVRSEKAKLENVREKLDEAAEAEADEFFDKLSDAEPASKN